MFSNQATFLSPLAILLAVLRPGMLSAEEPTAPPASRAKAVESIQAALADGKPGALIRAAQEVLALVPQNVLVAELLEPALEKTKPEDEAAIDRLREELREVERILKFQPFKEAPYPQGFPEPTPVGEIEVKELPAYRLARINHVKNEDGAFWTLFKHIKKNNIEMTAPVEMVYERNEDKGGEEQQSMAFLYQNLELGKLGADDKVEVVDVPAKTVVSMGMRGYAKRDRIADVRKRLDTWLTEHPEYRAAGELRVLGYNSPFIAESRRYFEVQMPLQKAGESDENAGE